MTRPAFVLLLVLTAAIPVCLGAGFAVGDREPAVKETNWIYGTQETYQTGQDGVIVLCQPKTNSPAFMDHKRAVPGDVAVMTCRAVKG